MSERFCIGTLLLLVMSFSIGGVLVTSASSSDSIYKSNDTEKMTDNHNIEYTVTFSKKENQVEIEAYNPTSRNRLTGFELRVDGYRNRDENLNLSPNETWKASWDFSNSIDATKKNHTVRFSILGNSIHKNFTRDISLSNSSKVPTPRITNVTVTNGTVYGNETVILEVTIENPADQLYGSNLMVHTLETNHSRVGGATAAPGSTSTVQVPLDEPRGATVAGEVRLYDRNLSDAEDGFDQREFVGRAGEDTQVWNRTYEPVEPYWGESSGYRYENETMEERIDNGNDESLDPVSVGVVAGLGVLVVTLLSLAARRLR